MNSKNINKTNNPTVSLIVHGGDDLGFMLSKNLLEQGGKVIIVDTFNSQTKKNIQELKKLGSADFIDIKKYNELLKNINRIDYVFYLLREKTKKEKVLNSSTFLEESNNLNTTLKAINRFNSKGSLITSLELNKQYGAKIINRNANIQPYTDDELQKYCEAITAEHRDKGRLNIRILRLGELLNLKEGKTENKTLDLILQEVKSRSQITIYGEGLDKHYLIDINDALYGILKLTFDDDTAGEVITLTNNNEYSTLTLAYKLLELVPDVKDIIFSKKVQTNNRLYDEYIPLNNASNYGWIQSVSIEESLKKECDSYGINKEIVTKIEEPVVEKVKEIETPLGKVINKTIKPVKFNPREYISQINSKLQALSFWQILKILTLSLVTIYITYTIIYPVILIVYGLGFSYLELKDISKDVVNNYGVLDDKLEKASNHIDSTSQGLEMLKWAFDITGQNSLYVESSQALFAIDYGLSGAKTIVSGVAPLQKYITEFQPALTLNDTLPITSKEYREELLALRSNKQLIEKGAYDLQIASSMLNNLKTEAFPGFMQEPIAQVKVLNDTLGKQIEPVKQASIMLPEILGLDERMTYIIVLQNPSEIRSTGGWISSYVLVSFENGQIRELKVDDVYNIDGQLQVQKISIPAPNSMRKALGINDMKLSLSNWNPNTKTTLNNIDYIFKQLETGSDIDGVVTLDTEVIKSLLRIYGDIKIPGETEVINSENFDSKLLELHSKFTPGESLKTSFLANLINSLLQRAIDNKGDEVIKQIESISTLLNNKSIQIYVDNENANTFLSKMNWNGELSKEHFNSPIVVEWNWGANKVNSKIERSVKLDIDIISESEVIYNYTVSMRNTSISNDYPFGEYVNYQRVILPLNAKIITLSGYNDSRYDEYLENGNRVIGGWFNVPIKSSKTFQIRYKVKQNTDTEFSPIVTDIDEIRYSLKQYKQPGILDLPIEIKITYPDTWAILEQGNFERYLNQLSLTDKTSTDIIQEFIWRKK